MAIQVTADQLDVFAILRELTAEERASMSPLFKVETYPAGKVIFREGDPGNKIYFVFKGVVQIEKGVDETNTARLARLGRGEILGEISVMDKSPRTATVTAYVDCELLTLTTSQLDMILSTHPRIAAKIFLGMAKSLSQRLRLADDEITQLTKRLYYF